MIAVNIESSYSLDEWVSFWKSKGAGEVLWAQDAEYNAVFKYRITALGTEVIVDRAGRLVFRSDGPAGYGTLANAIEKAL